MARVSICIPCYNYEKFIAAAIESCLAQTERDIEILVFNDRSTDRSAEIVKTFAASDSRVVLVENEQRMGLVGNFNRALFGGSAPYVKILCADDYLAPACVERLAGALDRYPQAAYATSDREIIFSNGERKRLRPGLRPDVPVAGRDLVRRSWLCFNLVGEPTTVLVRRSALTLGQGFDARYHHMLDWELWLRLAAAAPLTYVPEALSVFRWHDESESSLKKADAWAAYDLLRLSLDLPEQPSRCPHATRWEIKRLQALCLGRAFLGILTSLRMRNGKALRNCADLFARSFEALIGGKPLLEKLPFFARS